MFAFFCPAVHQAPLPEEKIDSTYRRLRWQIFAGIFFGYAGYYLLRKNFSLAMPYLIDEGYTLVNWAWRCRRSRLPTACPSSSWAWCPTAPTRATSCPSACWYRREGCSFLVSRLGRRP